MEAISKDLKDFLSGYLENLKKIPYSERFIDTGADGPIKKEIRGLPRDFQSFITTGEEIFRQYVNDINSYNLISVNAILRGGKIPYEWKVKNSSTKWIDMKGIFLTTPKFSKEDVGVPYNNYVVDLKLPAGIEILRFTDSIMLLPVPEEFEIQIQLVTNL